MEQIQHIIKKRSAEQYMEDYITEASRQRLPARDLLTQHFQRCMDETLASVGVAEGGLAVERIQEMAKAILATRKAANICPFCKGTSDCATHCIVMEAHKILRRYEHASLT